MNQLKKSLFKLIKYLSIQKHKQWCQWVQNIKLLVDKYGLQTIINKWQKYNVQFQQLDKQTKQMYYKQQFKKSYMKIIKPNIEQLSQIVNKQKDLKIYILIAFVVRLFKSHSHLLQLGQDDQWYILLQFKQQRFLQKIPNQYLYLFQDMQKQCVISIKVDNFKSIIQMIQKMNLKDVFQLNKSQIKFDDYEQFNLKQFHLQGTVK